MPNAVTFPRTVHAVTLERGGFTFLALWSEQAPDPMGADLGDDESAVYHGGRLVRSARPVRPVRCYEGARS